MTGWPPSDHEELQAYIVEELEHWNWDVDQEVVIDGNRRFRADIICEHDKWGMYGIECKYIQNGASPIGKAIRQIIHQYRNSTFDGEYISKWLISPYYTSGECEDDDYHQNKTHFYGKSAREICCALGIGWINLPAYREPGIIFDFAYSDKAKKIPAAGRAELAFEADVSAIENAIQGKVEYELV